MKRYVEMACTVCRRNTDRIVDNVRVTPDRCTITLNCLGRLVPVEYKSSAEIATAPEVGLTDWVPRNRTQTPGSPIQEIEFLDTASGVLQQLVLALPVNGAQAFLRARVQADTPKAFRQYTFRLETTFSTIGGIESAIEKKTLRYTATGVNPDVVEVFLNGVKLEIGTAPNEYQIFDGSLGSAVPPNTILFNVPISLPGTTQVDVIVSKAREEVVVTIPFTRNSDNDARLDKGAWENINSVQRFDGTTWQTFYLYSFDVLGQSVFSLNAILVPTGEVSVDTGTTLPILSSAPLKPCFLLARKPYAPIDRYLDVFANIDTFSGERDYLKYAVVDGAPALLVTRTSVSTSFPPFRTIKFNQELTAKTAIAGVQDQLTIDGETIVGPDV